jgi:pantoate kinase
MKSSVSLIKALAKRNYTKFNTIALSEFQKNPSSNTSGNKIHVFHDSVLLEPESLEKSIKDVMDVTNLKKRHDELKGKLISLESTLKSLDEIKTPIDNSIKAQLKRWQVYAVTYLGVQAAYRF